MVLKYRNKVFENEWTFQRDSAKPHTHKLSQKWCEDHRPPNSPDLKPLDYSVWDEFNNQVNWSKVQSKTTLIEELKQAVKPIRKEVVLESCRSWTNRLYHFKENKGDYLH